MIVFADSGYKPQTYLDRLRAFVDAYYSQSDIKQSSPTIVLSLNHIRFDLVPALSEGWGGYKIPSGPSYWQTTNPNDFNKRLTDKNAATNYNIKPVIRLAKIWNSSNGYPYDSYQFEQMIVDQFYWLCSNQRDYLFAFFDALQVPYDYQWRKDKVERAKKIIANVRDYEKNSMPASAEAEVKKLVPE